MRSKHTIKKHSIVIRGHSTSFSLENAFWDELQLIAKQNSTSVTNLIAEIDEDRKGNLSSAIRVYILKTKTHNYKS